MKRILFYSVVFLIYVHNVWINMGSLQTEIKPGDRVSVSIYKGSFYRGKYVGVAISWTDNGRLWVKSEKNGTVKVENPDNVKKLPSPQS